MFLSRSVAHLTPGGLSARPIRGWLILAAAAIAGIIAGLAAANASGPFQGLRPPVAHLVESQTVRTAVNAGALFPALKPQVVTRVVPVYMRPPAAPNPPQTQGGGDNNGPRSSPSPRPSPSRSPQPSPSPGGDD